MLYLRNNTITQAILVPKVLSDLDGEVTLLLESTVDLTSESLEVTGVQTTTGYYSGSVQLPDGMQSGEYKYTLSDESQILATGLLVIGEGDEAEETDKTIEYEQYERDI